MALAGVHGIAGRSDVVQVEANPLAWGQDTPNDTYYSSDQWAPQHIGAPSAWSETHGSTDVVVAVVDSGLDMSHPEMSGRYVDGYDFVNDDDDPTDDHGHGTHVSGIIGAGTDNSTGIAAIGWDTKLMPVKVLNSSNVGRHDEIAAGIVWAADSGADVINLSLGSTSTSQTLSDAVEYAHSEGALLVCAAGNLGDTDPFYPAAYDDCMAIGATTDSDAKWSASNYGSWLSMTAPGDAIYSTYIYSTGYPYVSWSGTSQAAPHVSAVAALMLAVDCTLSNADLRSALEETAVDLGDTGFDEVFGYGRLDAESAVESVGGMPTATNTPSVTPTATATATTSPLYTQYVNAGGDEYVDSAGVTYSSDQVYTIGSWGYLTGSAESSSEPVAGTTDDALYQEYREYPSEYRFDVPDGEYRVTLRFAEFVVRKDTDRLMSIALEDTVYETALSIYTEVGKYTALDRTYTVDVSDGVLNVALTKNGGKRDPVVSAVGVEQLDGEQPSQEPSPTPVPSESPPSEPEPTETPTDTPVPTATSTPTETPVGSIGMHVGDLDGVGVPNRNMWTAVVTITVHDPDHEPLANATVYGTWTGGYSGSGSCVTDSSGTCEMASGELPKSQGSVTYTVTNVTHATESYDSSANHDPDGDSDGTTIDVAKP